MLSKSLVEHAETEYEDRESLVRDFQSLLSNEAGLADFRVVVGDNSTQFLLHKQVLAARSPYFSTLLSQPWFRTSADLRHENTDTVQDVVEYLYTGAVQLETESGSAVRVAAAAHFMNVPDLEALALRHIKSTLNPATFPAHVTATTNLPGAAVPDSITRVFAEFVSRNPVPVLTSPALRVAENNEVVNGTYAGYSRIVRTIWGLLAYQVTETDGVGHPDCSSVCEGLAMWSQRYAQRRTPHAHHDCTSRSVSSPYPAFLVGYADRIEVDPMAVPMRAILEVCESAEERQALTAVLLRARPSVFARVVEPLGILRVEEVAAKYKASAGPSVFESTHPHTMGSTTSSRVSVVLGPRAAGASIELDPRTQLGWGSELCFYAVDPCGAAEPPYKTVSGRPSASDRGLKFDLPFNQFWFALLSPSEEVYDDIAQPDDAMWGFKFSVAAYT